MGQARDAAAPRHALKYGGAVERAIRHVHDNAAINSGLAKSPGQSCKYMTVDFAASI
jgi:hypothetical protein